MKKYSTIIIILFSSITLMAQFTSVQNGKWYWASTWSTDPNATAIPDSNDTAIIKHDVNLDGSGRCLNLIVDNGGRLHNGTIDVYGDLQNYGTINGRSEWNGMYVNLKGNLQNESIYDADTRFYGSSDQTVNCEDTLRLGRCDDYDPTSKIIFNSSTILADSWIFLRGSELIFADTLTIINSTLDGGTFDGYGNVLLGVGSDNVLGWKGAVSFGPQYTILKNIRLEGIHYIYGSGNIGDVYAIGISDNVVNNGTLTNAYVHGGGSTTFHILNDFTNNGLIQENEYDKMWMTFDSGNFINNGELKNITLTFINEHVFSNSIDSVGVSDIIGKDSLSKLIVVGDLIFNSDANIDMKGGFLTLPVNGKLINFGMTNTKLIANNSLISSRSNSVIQYSSLIEANIENLSIGYNSILLRNATNSYTEIIENGKLNIAHRNVQIFGNILNNGEVNGNTDSAIVGIVQNNGLWKTNCKIEGPLLNNGVIENFNMKLASDVTNNGYWNTSNKIEFVGDDNQTISMPTDSTIHTYQAMLYSMMDGSSYQWYKNGEVIPNETQNFFQFISSGIVADNANYSCTVDGNSSRTISIQSLTDTKDKKEMKNIDALPTEYSLSQNYPNPFNPTTTIEYTLKNTTHVDLVVFNLAGEVAKKIVNKLQSPGRYLVNFDASDLSSGIYIYQIVTNKFTDCKKMVLLK